MKIAYLILAHNTPNHLQRLINALSTQSSIFFIHIDKKSDLSAYSDIEGENIFFVKDRVKVYWGDFSQIEATITLIRSSLAQCNADRFVLLSGADYPLRSARYIEKFFEENAETEFISLIEMPSQNPNRPIQRLNGYIPHSSDSIIKILIRKLLVKIGAFTYQRDYRDYLNGLTPYAGFQWWALSRAACNYLLTFYGNEKKVINFFKNTLIPDESLYHTIMGNSPFKWKITGSLTYTDWSAGGGHPANISENHIDLFSSTNMIISQDVFGSRELLFARKFTDDSEILTKKINQLIAQKEDL